MVKKKNFGQRAILAAGTFANVVTSLLFLIILGIFFVAAFQPAGVMFDDYSYAVVEVSSITMVNGMNFSNPSYEDVSNYVKNASFNEIKVGQYDYIGIKGFSQNKEQVILYDNAPAIKSELNGAILEIDGVKVDSVEKLGEEISKHEIGDEITVKTKMKEDVKEYIITLEENPYRNGVAWLGVGFATQKESLINKITTKLSSFKKPNTYYEPKLGEFSWFIYYLLWWLILISVSVALINMLPMGIFDGGRFFYLTILAITGKEEWAKKSYKFLTMFFLLILFALMAIWAWGLMT